MLLDSSLDEGLSSLYHLYMDAPPQPSSLLPTPSATLGSQSSRTLNNGVLITTPPELRLRNPIPEPQAADCQQADQSASQAAQSASQAVQQANQQASQSIQQAQQQASQSVSQAQREANQSASQAIQQFSNSASQSIAAASQSVSAASRSVTSAIQSASNAIASAESSAAAAISRANGSMAQAQASATMAQGQASLAVLQAGAAVAAATGSAAAAGSSFLAAAAKATQSAQASVSAIGAQASQVVSQASQQVTASQNAAVTATQAALAIVGSIIASTLITILIFFLIVRHKKKAKGKSRADPSLGNVYFADPKFPLPDQTATTAVPSQAAYTGDRGLDPMSGSQVTFSLFSKPTTDDKVSETTKKAELRQSVVKSTTVPWNPNRPPKAPTLGSWLKLQDGVSPFGPIKLPLDDEESATPGPLGGQLKSPLTTKPPQRSPRMSSGFPKPTQNLSLIPTRSPRLPILTAETPTVSLARSATVTAVPHSPITLLPTTKSNSQSQQKATQQQQPDALPRHSLPGPSYRESKASVWTDDLPDPSPSPPLQSPPPELRNAPVVNPFADPSTSSSAPNNRNEKRTERRPINSMQKVNTMDLPAPTNPVRNTAEWFKERAMKLERSSTSIGGAGMGMGGGGAMGAGDDFGKRQMPYGNRSSAYAEQSQFQAQSQARKSFGLPRGPKAGFGAMPGPGPRKSEVRNVRRSEAEGGYGMGLGKFLDRGKGGEKGGDGGNGGTGDGRGLSRMGSDRTDRTLASTPGGKSVASTPGVGKAM